MRQFSKKRTTLNNAVRPIRQAFIARIGECMNCGCSERSPNRNLPLECSKLTVHEICNGPMRRQALDRLFACLVLCAHCNERMCDKKTWPEAKQLALLLVANPDDYDLDAYIRLTSPQAPRRILPEEVHGFLQVVRDR